MVAVSNVLLVSHNPLVGNLLSYLQHGAGHPPERVSTAGLAELKGDELLVGSMKLDSIKHP
jgi:phosphohistidine phosphatase